MEVTRWNVRSLPLNADDEEPAARVFFRPMPTGWQARIMEQVQASAIEDGSTPQQAIDRLREVAAAWHALHAEMLRDLVVGFEGVRINGGFATLDQILALLTEDEQQTAELARMIADESRVGARAGKR